MSQRSLPPRPAVARTIPRGRAPAPAAGVDFGTSNSLVSLWVDGRPVPVPLEDGASTLPSLLYVPRRMRPPPEPGEAWVARAVAAAKAARGLRGRAAADPALEARLAAQARAEFSRDAHDRALAAMRDQSVLDALAAGAQPRFGRDALAASLEDPEGFFFRSPKSFLAARVDDALRARFERIVELALAHLRAKASAAAGAEVVRACIGRPVHFGGGAADERRDGDARALALVEAAARRAGFQDLCFEYEPVAAALDFERGLARECVALIVDVGGGTTDCTVARLGPRARGAGRRPDAAAGSRTDDILASSGERVGGNDVDTALSFAGFMPAMGRRDHDRRGLPMPAALFADAAEFFDIPAQARFQAAGSMIAGLSRDSDEDVAERLAHLETLRAGRHGAWLTVRAEQAKIALAEAGDATVTLDRIDPAMTIALGGAQLADASRRLVAVIERLIAEALAQAGTAPQVVYVTGGSARSPLVRQAIGRVCPGVPIEYGDAWGSVVSGLAVRAGSAFA